MLRKSSVLNSMAGAPSLSVSLAFSKVPFHPSPVGMPFRFAIVVSILFCYLLIGIIYRVVIIAWMMDVWLNGG